MCFTPQISFLIFAIEWTLGLIILKKAEKARERKRERKREIGLCRFADSAVFGKREGESEWAIKFK